MSTLSNLLNKEGIMIENSISNGAGAAGGIRFATQDAWSPDSGDGLILDVDAEPTQAFTKAPIIAIDFPAFADGRGLSLAVLLRSRYQYTGELRATGDVHPDLLHYMKRCGFDTFLMSQERSGTSTVEQSALAPYSDYYQASVLEPKPAYRRIRRGA
jgi:uncharacterized protein (DUF934 family)